jgi:hypothetical protein
MNERDASYTHQNLETDLSFLMNDAIDAGAILMDCIRNMPSKMSADACPPGMRRFLRQKTDEAAVKVREHLARLKKALPAVEGELRRLDANMRRLQTDGTVLSAAILKTHYSEAYLDQKRKYGGSLLERNRIKDVIAALERALELSQSDYGPQVAAPPRQKRRGSMIDAERKVGIWRK